MANVDVPANKTARPLMSSSTRCLTRQRELCRQYDGYLIASACRYPFAQSQVPAGVPPNNDGDIVRPHDACRCGEPAPTDKEQMMADSKLSAQFDTISDKAKAAGDTLKAANERTREQLATDVDTARNRAAAAADHVKGKADAARDTASSHWQELRNNWHAHVEEVHSRVNKHLDKIDAKEAAADADL